MAPGRTYKKIWGMIAALFFTLAFPLIGCKVADFFEFGFSIRWLYIHHSIQLLLAVLSIFLISISFKKRAYSWGLNFENWQWSLKVASVFAVVWFVISLILNLVFRFQSTIKYELTTINIVSDLFFDFVLTGFSEEILFRGLIMGILLHTWQGNFSIGDFKISIAGIITTFLFALAHIGIDYENFTIISISPLQLIFTLFLGLFYAIMRDKTKSLLGPMLIHGASDGLITVIQLLLISI